MLLKEHGIKANLKKHVMIATLRKLSRYVCYSSSFTVSDCSTEVKMFREQTELRADGCKLLRAVGRVLYIYFIHYSQVVYQPLMLPLRWQTRLHPRPKPILPPPYFPPSKRG
jgi:hypothetical protein